MSFKSRNADKAIDGGTKAAAQHASQACRRGFSLIELLAAIAVVAILLAILMSGIGYVRDVADNTQCVSNLRQIGMGIHSYSLDNSGKLPGPTFSAQQATYSLTKYQNTLAAHLASYLGSPAISSTPTTSDLFLCPGYQSIVPESEWALGYAYVASLSLRNDKGGFVLQDGIKVIPWGHIQSNPSSPNANADPMELAIVASLTNPSTAWAIQDVDNLNDPRTAGRAGIAQEPVHHSHRNRLYFDWHVESVPVDED